MPTPWQWKEVSRYCRRGQGRHTNRREGSNGARSNDILFPSISSKYNPVFLFCFFLNRNESRRFVSFKIKVEARNIHVRADTWSQRLPQKDWRGEKKKKTLLMSIPFLVPKMDSRPSPLLPLCLFSRPTGQPLGTDPGGGGQKGEGGPACHVTPRGANVRS